MIWSRFIPTVTDHGAILCFHGISARDEPPAGETHVPFDLFTAVMDTVRASARVVPLRELVERQRAGKTTAGLIALTFDDAYLSLRGGVADFLASEQLPATVFVATEATAAGGRFWWDRLDVLHSRVSADQWRRFEDACGVPKAFRRGQPAELGPVRPFRQWLLAEHAGRLPGHVDEQLRAMETSIGGGTRQRAMDFSELDAFRHQTAADVAVHTRSHPVLPLLDDDEFQSEVAGAARLLKDRFSDTVPFLAIPYGLFDRRTIRLAREAGLEASMTLTGTTLRFASPEQGFPRVCLTRSSRPWKLVLRINGLTEAFRDRFGSKDRVPALPSAAT